jgi:HAD superfamily hydrolase (TIGR01509 family)
VDVAVAGERPVSAAITPRLVIFDCDGVLVDSETISNRVLAEMLTREGLETDTAQARAAYQGLLLAEVARSVEQRLGRELPEGWIERYERVRAEAFRTELTAIEGASEVLVRLADVGVRTCVASQGRHAKMSLSLALTGLDELLPEQRRFSAEDVPRGKPHPDLFLHAARTIGVGSGEAVVVEDTALGVQAAVRAGMRVFGYAADSDPVALAAAGAELLGSLAELPVRLGLG